MDVKELKAQLEYKNKNVFDIISEDELEDRLHMLKHISFSLTMQRPKEKR